MMHCVVLFTIVYVYYYVYFYDCDVTVSFIVPASFVQM